MRTSLATTLAVSIAVASSVSHNSAPIAPLGRKSRSSLLVPAWEPRIDAPRSPRVNSVSLAAATRV